MIKVSFRRNNKNIIIFIVVVKKEGELLRNLECAITKDYNERICGICAYPS
jgi:hypothetical protein